MIWPNYIKIQHKSLSILIDKQKFKEDCFIFYEYHHGSIAILIIKKRARLFKPHGGGTERLATFTQKIALPSTIVRIFSQSLELLNQNHRIELFASFAVFVPSGYPVSEAAQKGGLEAVSLTLVGGPLPGQAMPLLALQLASNLHLSHHRTCS